MFVRSRFGVVVAASSARMLRFCISMSPENHDSSQVQSKPRVGIPWRTRDEERHHHVEKLNYYFEASGGQGAYRNTFAGTIRRGIATASEQNSVVCIPPVIAVAVSPDV